MSHSLSDSEIKAEFLVADLVYTLTTLESPSTCFPTMNAFHQVPVSSCCLRVRGMPSADSKQSAAFLTNAAVETAFMITILAVIKSFSAAAAGGYGFEGRDLLHST